MSAFCKLIRVLTLPSVLTGAMVLLLWCPGAAMSGEECLMSELFLFLIPLLAYPARELFHVGEDRRSGQRTLAMIFSTAGYVLGLVWALWSGAGRLVQIIFGSYILSVLVLLFLNKALHFRASGHACSSTAPLFFLCWKLGPLWALPCLFLIGAVYHSSLLLERHTWPQLLCGSCISAAACALTLFIF